MEKLLLLWDELDELGVYGQHLLSGLSGAVRRLSLQVGDLVAIVARAMPAAGRQRGGREA